MTNQITIARPYARAIFSVALKHNCCANWLEYLLLLSNITSNQKVILFLKNPMICIDKKIHLLTSCCSNTTDIIFTNFLKILATRNRLLFLSSICKLFKNYMYEKDNTLDVMVTTAFLLKENEQKKLLYLLSEKFNKKIFVNFFVNPFLIGGILIKTGNNIFNNSVRESLIFFHNHLLKS